MVEHVSDAFVDVTSPLDLLCEAAQAGDTQLTEERAVTFTEHAKQLEKVGMNANLHTCLPFSGVTLFLSFPLFVFLSFVFLLLLLLLFFFFTPRLQCWHAPSH